MPAPVLKYQSNLHDGTVSRSGILNLCRIIHLDKNLHCKVKFAKIFGIVHVEETVNIGGPTDAVDNRFIGNLEVALENRTPDRKEDHPEK